MSKTKTTATKAKASKATKGAPQIKKDGKGRFGAGYWAAGSIALRLVAKCRENMAVFKHGHPPRDLGFHLFEPYFERRKASHHKEKAVRRFRRTAPKQF